MNKELQIKALVNEINGLLLDYNCPVSPEMNQQKEHLSNSFGILAPLQHQSFHLFDLNKGCFVSANSIHETKLYKPVVIVHQPPYSSQLIELTHPDDIITSLRFELAALQFLLQLPSKRTKEFSAVNTRRLKNKKGEYEYYTISYKVVVSDENEKPWLLMMHCKYSPLMQPRENYQYRIISIEPYDLIRKSKIFDKKEFIYLTDREMEVVAKVNNGYEKVEIADMLHISPETIKTHYKHIVKKTGLSYIHQACLYLVRMGTMPLWITLYILFGDDLMLTDLLDYFF
jgi:DNA-binding CsgD family transcriptional regulator